MELKYIESCVGDSIGKTKVLRIVKCTTKVYLFTTYIKYLIIYDLIDLCLYSSEVSIYIKSADDNLFI